MYTKRDGPLEDEATGADASEGLTATRSGWDMGGSLGFDTASRSQSADVAFDLEGFDTPSASLSLDDLEDGPEPSADTTPPLTVAASDEWEYQPPAALNGTPDKRRRKRMILATALLACIGIASAVAVPAYKAMKAQKPPLIGKKNVRQALVVPEFQEDLDFLVLATSEQGKNLLSIRLSFVFAASNAFETFSGQSTLYREAVYQYLLRTRPSRNSQKLWQGILEKQLTEYLKQTFPGSGLRNIRVAHWERL